MPERDFDDDDLGEEESQTDHPSWGFAVALLVTVVGVVVILYIFMK